ncbi:unnamed protein product [Paramecium primaurelia]|uniref:Uncharacterized protein n=1 Tax=Paramecium primaurelia TaxID=5886 RepID=A0A8S1MSD4_PARPR|nr:unnamed protein product [Paramecium primaurelia]
MDTIHRDCFIYYSWLQIVYSLTMLDLLNYQFNIRLIYNGRTNCLMLQIIQNYFLTQLFQLDQRMLIFRTKNVIIQRDLFQDT